MQSVGQHLRRESLWTIKGINKFVNVNVKFHQTKQVKISPECSKIMEDNNDLIGVA